MTSYTDTTLLNCNRSASVEATSRESIGSFVLGLNPAPTFIAI